MTSRDRTTTRTAPPPGAVPLLPAAAFVLVWSSGYIAGPAGVDVVEPFTLLTLRFGVAALLLAPLAWWLRGPMRMTRHELLRVGAVGLVLNAVQFGLMYVGFALGLGATLAALLHSLSPVLTVVLAGLLLGRAAHAGCRWPGSPPASSGCWWCSVPTSTARAAGWVSGWGWPACWR